MKDKKLCHCNTMPLKSKHAFRGSFVLIKVISEGTCKGGNIRLWGACIWSTAILFNSTHVSWTPVDVYLVHDIMDYFYVILRLDPCIHSYRNHIRRVLHVDWTRSARTYFNTLLIACVMVKTMFCFYRLKA